MSPATCWLSRPPVKNQRNPIGCCKVSTSFMGPRLRNSSWWNISTSIPLFSPSHLKPRSFLTNSGHVGIYPITSQDSTNLSIFKLFWVSCSIKSPGERGRGGLKPCQIQTFVVFYFFILCFGGPLRLSLLLHLFFLPSLSSSKWRLMHWAGSPVTLLIKGG